LIRTVPRSDLQNYYAMADVFVLASLLEGFGMVYIEALSKGIPVIAHEYPVSRYVLKSQGFFTDLSLENKLAVAMEEVLKIQLSADKMQERHQFVYENYSWEQLKPAYMNMFEKAFQST
jgi:1,2-diacylglycerol 3-alpha-glucosyltransferase